MNLLHARTFAWLLPFLGLSIPQDWYVDRTADCFAGDGSPSNPFCEITAAVDAASNGDTIHIAPGTYREMLTLHKELTLIGTAGRDVTIVDANQQGRVFVVFQPTTISGLTITGGYGDYTRGGGLGVAAPLTLTNSTVTGNTADGYYGEGGGLSIYGPNGSLVMRDTIVTQNYVDGVFGYGAAIYGGPSEIVNCRIENNTVDAIWGPAYAIYAPDSLTMTNTIVINNHFWDMAYDPLNDVLFWGDDFEATNCTFGELGFVGATPPEPAPVGHFKNCVFADGPFIHDGTYGPIADVTIDSSLFPFPNILPGSNNIIGTPEFVDALNGDYRLLPTAPGVDAGNNAFVPAHITLDLSGAPRFRDVLAAPDKGQGVGPLVDMGAFEARNEWSGTPKTPVRGIY